MRGANLLTSEYPQQLPARCVLLAGGRRVKGACADDEDELDLLSLGYIKGSGCGVLSSEPW